MRRHSWADLVFILLVIAWARLWMTLDPGGGSPPGPTRSPRVYSDGYGDGCSDSYGFGSGG